MLVWFFESIFLGVELCLLVWFGSPFVFGVGIKKTSMNHKNGLTGPLEVSTKKMDEIMFRSWLRPKRRHPCLVFSTIETWKKSTCILRMVPGSYLRECQLVDTKVRSWASRYADVILFESIILLMEEIRLTSWYGKYLIIYRGSYMSGECRISEPSTVLPYRSSDITLQVFTPLYKYQMMQAANYMIPQWCLKHPIAKKKSGEVKKLASVIFPKQIAVTIFKKEKKHLVSGQIIVFHQPRFPWNNRISPTSATFWGFWGRCWGRYTLTGSMKIWRISR